MRYWAFVWLAIFAFHCVFSLPVDKKSKSEDLPPNANPKVEEEIDNLGLEYGRYLQEVVMALEQDKDFSKKLENISAEDIKSGKIAGELDFVHHSVRTKLDELKRVEMDRLHKLLKQQHDLDQAGGSYVEQDGRKWRTLHKSSDDRLGHLMTQYEHLDHSDPHSFSKDDLHKLIVKATADLEELDKKRREEFKQYEMEKEFQYQESLKNMSDPDKQEAIKKHDEQLNKHKQHARLHAPGSKQQLEEVWQEQDHMPKEEFNPKTFFSLRDVNGDGVLDQEEVESMLSLEVRKLYDPNNPEDDPNEMMEEFHRMREQFYKEADKDHDGVITKKEFLDLTARADFEKDPGWKGLDENPVYTQQELHEYEKHRQQALEHQYAYYMPEYHGAPQQHHPGQFVPPPHAPPPVGYQQQGYIPQPPHPGYAGAPPPPQPYQAYPNQPYPQHPGYQPLQQQQTNYQAHQQPQPNYQAPNQQQPGYQGPNQQQPGYQPHPGNFQANPPAPQLAAQPNLQQNPNQPSLAAQYQQPSASQQYQQPPLNNPYPPQSNQAYPQQNVGYQQPSQAASNPAANSNQQNHPAAGQPVAQQVGSPPKH